MIDTATLHPLERKVIPFLEKAKDIHNLAKLAGMDEVETTRAVQWLAGKDALKVEEHEKESIVLGSNGKVYKDKGLPERRFLEALSDSPQPISKISQKAHLDPSEINICIGLLKQKNAISISKERELQIAVTKDGKKAEFPEEKFLKKLPLGKHDLSAEDRVILQSLLKRKDIIAIEIAKTRSYTLTHEGKKLTSMKIDAENIIDTLTAAQLKSGEWKNKKFRKYNLLSPLSIVYGGKRHFVNQAIDDIKKIWIEMGFKEMNGPNVMTSFWDLDALFVPQDHPARQMQDTFYIKSPNKGSLPAIAKRIKDAHEKGVDGKGWGGNWKEEIAKENLLITHDTYLSAQTLANLKKEDLPFKSFQIMKVFRNEALDWKHLFEFYQIGGIVVDKDANFRNLLGYLKTFFKKMGFEDVRIRPAHFPYVEPGAQIEVFHPKRKEWLELGGSGIFRPEVTKPLLGFECPVLAWGFGLERIISDFYKITDIRDVYKNDLKQLREMKMWK